MTIKLTINDRTDILKYVHRLPCTLMLRKEIDSFFNQLELTPEEFKQFDVQMDPKTFKLTCNDPSYVVEYSDLNPTVLNSIKEYVKLYDIEDFHSNNVIQNTLIAFKKLI